MNEHLILGISIFWLVTGWLGAGFMIRRVYRHGARKMQRIRPALHGVSNYQLRMKPMKIAVVAMTALLASATAAYCQPRKETADWYLAHPDETAVAREWCAEHPTERDAAVQAGDRTCINVYEAATQLTLRKIKRQN
jgi:hypothetical protein